MINTVEQDQVAVWSESTMFIRKSSYVINTVKQEQEAVWSDSAVFITKSSYRINTVEQDQVAMWSGSAVFIKKVILDYKHCRTRSISSVIRICSVYNKDILYD